MVILLDTNVILDHFIPRQPFVDTANDILNLCFQQKCSGYIAAHSITNIFYILRKQFSESERKKMLIELCEFIEVAGIQRKQVIEALTDDTFNDFEDCLQVECAKFVNADYIITRNTIDFSTSPILAILPEDFLQKIQ
jgi:predicted nucleic acid-binding protein